MSNGTNSNDRSRGGVSRRNLRAVVIAVGVLGALSCPVCHMIAVRESAETDTTASRVQDQSRDSPEQESAEREATERVFEQIGLILDIYADTHRRLPDPVRRGDSGRPLHSWRLTILPYDENPATITPTAGIMRWPIGKPWSAKESLSCRELRAAYCYEDLSGRELRHCTSVFALTGPGTAFGDGEAQSPRSLDGLDSDTVLCVEVRNSECHWMAPGDFDIRDMPNTINARDGDGISSRYEAGFHVLFADGSVWFISRAVPFEMLSRFFTVDGAKNFDRNQVLGVYRL